MCIPYQKFMEPKSWSSLHYRKLSFASNKYKFDNNTFFIDHIFCYCYQCIGVDDSLFSSLSCVLVLPSQFFTKDAHIWPMRDHQICSPLLPFAPKSPAQTLEWPRIQLSPSSLLSSMPCCDYYLTSDLNNLTSILTQNDAAFPLLVLHYDLSTPAWSSFAFTLFFTQFLKINLWHVNF